MDGLNLGTYYFFRGLARETPALRAVMRGVDLLGSFPVLSLIALIIVTVLILRRNQRGAMIVFFTVVAGMLLIEGVNRLLGSPRPPEADEAYAGIEQEPSFASRSAFFSSLVYGLLAVLGGSGSTWPRRLLIGGGCVLLVVAIGFSQLYLRLEFLTALLAGWAVGAVALLVCWQLAPAGR